ncbi:MAG: Crp/Fnr family transcriptional regulator [Balneolaceae bacterium]|nr:MAG: Crp/Fnr family transcriptional regulator [Balneolaceae bacterium]
MDTLDNVKELQPSKEVISELRQTGTIKILQKGDVLLQEHSTIRNIPIILKGSVKVYQTDDDYREMLLYTLKEGDTCIMSFLGGLYNDVSKIRAVSDEESEVLLIPVEKLGVLTRKHPEWNNYIFRVYHQRFNELLEVVNAVAFKKMDERLLNYITSQVKLTGNPSLEITHEELANELGTARVVVSRLLKQMENEGLVQLGRNKITLL